MDDIVGLAEDLYNQAAALDPAGSEWAEAFASAGFDGPVDATAWLANGGRGL